MREIWPFRSARVLGRPAASVAAAWLVAGLVSSWPASAGATTPTGPSGSAAVSSGPTFIPAQDPYLGRGIGSMRPAASAGPATPTSAAWSLQTTPNVKAPNGYLSGIACTSPLWCMAVGSYTDTTGSTAPLVETWNGASWSQQATPVLAGWSGTVLTGVSCPAPKMCQAVGYAFSTTTFAQEPIAATSTATGWTLHQINVPEGFLSSVSCASVNYCVAVGSVQGFNGVGPLAASWNGTRWSAAGKNPAVSPFSQLGSVSCLPDGTCMAVGASQYGSFAERRTATSGWRLVPTVNYSNSVLSSVSCSTETDCVSVGSYVNSFGIQVTLAETWNGTTWSAVASRNPAGSSFLNGVTCPSASDCMAVGGSGGRNLTESWNGSGWTLRPSANPAGSTNIALIGVSCASAQACVSVGSFVDAAAIGVSSSLIWGGSAWKYVAPVNPTGAEGTSLTSVACPAGGNCVAVGYYGGQFGGGSLALTSNGGTWSIQTIPEPAGVSSSALASVSCPTATRCVAVGSSLGGVGPSPLIESWNGKSWSIQPLAVPSGSQGLQLYSVSCYSAASCTAVGVSYGSTGSVPVAAVWNGSTWTSQTMPAPSGTGLIAINSVACPTAQECVAVGDYLSAISGKQLPIAEQWNGTRWILKPLPTVPDSIATALLGVSCPSATECTAVGGHLTKAQLSMTLGETWNGSTWTPASTPTPTGASQTILITVSCAAIGACTSVGYSDAGTLAESASSSAWSVQPTPNPQGAAASELLSTSCRAPTTCQAVGVSIGQTGLGSSLAEKEG